MTLTDNQGHVPIGWTIAVKDATDMWRDGRFRWSAGVLLAILSTSFLTGWSHAATTARLHREAQDVERQLSLDKGEMNPHAAAHYGAFVFKPIEPLTGFDPGIEPYVGVAVFLEAHQQQLARHRPAEDATAARRLGELSAATALQVLVPLLIVLLTYPAFAGEREAGTLRQLSSLGVGRFPLAIGKIAGAIVPLAAVLLPATAIGVAAMMWSAPLGFDADAMSRAVGLSALYLGYFTIWAALGLAVSAFATSSNAALTILVGLWFANCFVAPPLTSALAQLKEPSTTGVQFTIALDEARGRLPRWDERVAAVEERFLTGELDLGVGMPSNPEVIALVEAERDETALFDGLFDRLFARFDRQAGVFANAGWFAPRMAIQQLSMGLAGTDYATHRRFVEATGRYREAFVQSLNAELTSYGSADTFDYTRGRDLWQRIPEFEFEPPTIAWSLGQHVTSLTALATWLATIVLLLVVTVRGMRVD